MEPSTQKLIHTFGALADLGQEIAGTGDFNEMVRTSMHLLLGTLALRRGAADVKNASRARGSTEIGLGGSLIQQISLWILPILVAVSRKSFLARLTGRNDPGELGAATVAAELFAAMHGADFIRTHDPGAFRDALAVNEALEPRAGLTSD